MTPREAATQRQACESEVRTLEERLHRYQTRMVGTGFAFDMLHEKLTQARERLRESRVVEQRAVDEILHPRISKQISLRHPNGHPKSWTVVGRRQIKFWETRLQFTAQQALDTIQKHSLRDIFSFRYGYGEHDPRAIEHLEQALAAGLCNVQRVLIPQTTYWGSVIEIFSGRSAAHKHKCAETCLWFSFQGLAWTARQADLHYGGGLADVAAVDRSIFVECGFTQASKILNAVAQEQRVLVYPYDDTGNGYLFGPWREKMSLKPVPAMYQVSPALSERFRRTYFERFTAPVSEVTPTNPTELGRRLEELRGLEQRKRDAVQTIHVPFKKPEPTS